ncbi:Protein STRUBBELIG-RECEPTOR FAMILY 3 [Acorus gramineus]|uniref:Protein STRUBBELIG-RECEPTOR FAMILY 3 n=1 Tax=Acorus gramineus TaxID=55184 RepID=A0AAV9BL52_ACOGR|nr:Protein STRUBBELIG-RECEPTOR FAMILY 3 [Acorus gramineus]
MDRKTMGVFAWVFAGLIMAFTGKVSHGITDVQDVYAINNLYTALGSPPLPGWIPNAGDPCVENWQGVQCVGPNITSIDLSNNHIGGIIPDSLPRTIQKLSLNNNLLTGELPDVFQSLTSLTNLDIENNLFSGPVPTKLLSIPNFTKDGNPFNTSVAPSPSFLPPAPGAPASEVTPADGPSLPDGSEPVKHKKFLTTSKAIAIGIAGALVGIALLLSIFMCLCRKRKSRRNEFAERPEVRAYGSPKSKPKPIVHVPKENNEVKKVPEEAIQKKEEHDRTTTASGAILLPAPVGKVMVNPIVPLERKPENSPKNQNPPTSATSFSIASLQQYTENFREDNLIRDDTLGQVYRAELPDGKLLAVMKLNNVNSMLKMDEFLDLVLTLSELRHSNVVELVGYCAEHEQRLLVYKYFSDKTLNDVLHSRDEFEMNLSWVARVKVALGAAKALEYLHEGCQLPVIHRNFESGTVLINDELAVCVSDCGLASLDLSRSVTQFHDINALSRMVDPSISGKYPVKSLSRLIDIISRCIQSGPEFRPLMSEVVQDLTRMLEELSSKRPEHLV